MASGDVEINILDREVLAALNKSVAAVEPATRRAFESAGGRLVKRQRENLTKHGKVDRGESGGLLGAITFKIAGRRGQMTLIAGPTAENNEFADQARTIEGGRAPGSKMPPPGALIPWMQRKGIPEELEWRIGRQIADIGMWGQPFPFIAPSLDQEMGGISDDLEGILNAIERAWGS